MNYDIKTIPHSEHRYETVGDYWETQHGMAVRVSDMGNKTYELAVIIHELIEQHLCELAGINFADIDLFDTEYEAAGENKGTFLKSGEVPKVEGFALCGCPIQDEPGMDIHAPYHKQHVFATKLEREFMDEAGWAKYDKTINDLTGRWKRTKWVT